MPMKRGTQVSWMFDGGLGHGHGVTIADEDDGHIMVAVAEPLADCRNAYPVIWCAVTWLTVTA